MIHVVPPRPSGDMLAGLYELRAALRESPVSQRVAESLKVVFAAAGLLPAVAVVEEFNREVLPR